MIAIGECLCSDVKYEVDIGQAEGRLYNPSSDTSSDGQKERSENLSNSSSPSQILVCSCSMCRRAS